MDRFDDATEQDTRDVFRRINSYTVPLNPEEQRHARFQGEFKWFIHRQMETYAPTFKAAGVLTEKNINRMADAKLLTEVVHAMINGITTTNARSLRKLYADYDREFEPDRDLTRRLSAAHRRFEAWELLPKALRKHYHAYSLLLALLAAQQAIDGLSPIVGRHRALRNDRVILRNLAVLSAILERDPEDVPGEYRTFYEASEKGTNVKAARETRCRWYYKALTSDSI
jgi:hypothetical protein